jgi:hypothetical protein
MPNTNSVLPTGEMEGNRDKNLDVRDQGTLRAKTS